MKHFAADGHRFRKRGRARRDHEELLKGQRVARVLAAVDHVEARHRRRHRRQRVPRQIRVVLVQRHALGARARLGRRQGNAQDRVRSQVALVRRTVQREHRLVDFALIRRVHAFQRRAQHVVHVLHRLPHALPQKPRLPIPQFHRFVNPRRRSRRHLRPEQALLRRDVHFHRWVAPRVDHLSPLHARDRRRQALRPLQQPHRPSSRQHHPLFF
mmetsp:Transcript_12160/g.36651  ORF Transcript_12160/g.36651 Transcript_12160/m.36651 type:complete len:213 (-) Transcript_12160:35-673(-)